MVSARRERHLVGNNVDFGGDSELSCWVERISGPREGEDTLNQEGSPAPEGRVHGGAVNSVALIVERLVEPDNRIDAFTAHFSALDQTEIALRVAKSVRVPHVDALQLGRARLSGGDRHGDSTSRVGVTHLPVKDRSLKDKRMTKREACVRLVCVVGWVGLGFSRTGSLWRYIWMKVSTERATSNC